MGKKSSAKATPIIAEVKALLKLFAREGKRSWGFNAMGFASITATSEKLEQYFFKAELADFWAKYFGVDVDRFTKWRDYLRSNEPGPPEVDTHSRGQCSFVKQSGKRCTKKTEKGRIDLPNFYAGYHDCCGEHQRELTHEEQIETTMRVWKFSREEAIAFLALPENEREAIMTKAINVLGEQIQAIPKW